MAITYPRVLPVGFSWTDCKFTQITTARGTRKKNGRVPRLITGTPYWHAMWKTQPLDINQRRMIVAWYDSLADGEKTFFGYDVGHRYPADYKDGTNGWGAWDGIADVTNITASTISVTGALANLSLKTHDYVTLLKPTGQRHLHRIMEDIVLNGSGAGDLLVRPLPLTLVYPSPYTTYNVEFLGASCEFIIEPNSLDVSYKAGSHPVSFSAVQLLPE